VRLRLRRVDPDNPSSIRSLARLAGNLNNKPAARNDHTAQPGAEPTLNRFALKPLALAHDRRPTTYQDPRTTGFLNVISAPFADVHILIAIT
jgi:hypothetical protein